MTCNFTMLDGDAVVYLDRVEAAWPLRMTLSSGSRMPLRRALEHLTSLRGAATSMAGTFAH